MMRLADSRTVAAAVGAGYTLAFLYLLGDLDRSSVVAWGLVIGDPGAWLDRRGLLHFEAIAMLEFGPLLWLFSPLNVLQAVVLGGLLAANLDGAWQLWRHQRVCAPDGRAVGTRGAGGVVVGALPALLAGGACCAPSLLLLFGTPGLGALAGFFGWLLPLSLLLLAAGRWLQRRQGAPPFIRR